MKKKIISLALIFVMGISGILTPTNTVDITAKATKVYVTDTGSKYHHRDCRTLYRSKNLYKMSVKKAKRAGYTACKVCF